MDTHTLHWLHTHTKTIPTLEHTCIEAPLTTTCPHRIPIHKDTCTALSTRTHAQKLHLQGHIHSSIYKDMCTKAPPTITHPHRSATHKDTPTQKLHPQLHAHTEVPPTWFMKGYGVSSSVKPCPPPTWSPTVRPLFSITCAIGPRSPPLHLGHLIVVFVYRLAKWREKENRKEGGG